MPKNLIFILSDQHRWDAIGSENGNVQTPNLDRMSGQGVRFRHCYCATQACVPSRASIMTGRYQEEHKMQGNGTILGRHERTWAQHLSERGYQTVAVGRTHHIDKGFDSVVRVPSGDSYPMNCHDPKLQQHWRKDAYIGPSPAPFEEYYEKRITDTAIAFLREMVRGGDPFALYVGYLQPHAAFTPPEPFWSMYRDLQVELPQDAPPPADMEARYRTFSDHVDNEKYNQIVRGYYAMVTCMDACIGFILDEVERLGIGEDTLVVYTSDHGEMLGDKGLHSKGYGYDPSIRVPMIASCPGSIPAARVTDALLEQVDLANTIMEALGVEPMPSRSRSAWPVMTGDVDTHRDWIYSTLGNGFVYRSEEKKWIHRIVKQQPIDELYDLRTDPRENGNEAGTPEGGKIIASLYPVVMQHMLTQFRRPITDFDPEAVQPRLIPYYST